MRPTSLVPLIIATLIGLSGYYALVALAAPESSPDGALPPGFVYLDVFDERLEVDLRYATSRNFTGRRVPGYEAPRAILTYRAATALEAVQDELEPFGLGLKVFDAYRPQQAVNSFVLWAQDLEAQGTKEAYYPRVPKEKLFEELYIADRSSHSRGSTVDVTLVVIDQAGGEDATGERAAEGHRELDMGTGYDYFDLRSWPDSPDVTPQQRANRVLLRTVMLEHGFKPYEREWWHFTLAEEPFPETYFDFPVR